MINISIRNAKNLNPTVIKYNEPIEQLPHEKSDSPASEEAPKEQPPTPAETKKSGKKGGKDSAASKTDRVQTPVADPSKSTAQLIVPEPEMLVMTHDEVREYRRAKLYKNQVDNVAAIFTSDKICRKDCKIYFPGNHIFKQLIY